MDSTNVVDDQKTNMGQSLRALRNERQLSIRALADKSGLNVNTISLIENGKTSPSVATLQQLATAMDVPITAFFMRSTPHERIAYSKAGDSPSLSFAHGTLEDLAASFSSHGAEPYLVTLEPQADSGTIPIVHTGLEFVFCLLGQIVYIVDENTYILEPGDSLLFEAHLPHSWRNTGQDASRSLLMLCPSDERDQPFERHFPSMDENRE